MIVIANGSESTLAPTRAVTIAQLTKLVDGYQLQGETLSSAIRKTAAEVGLHPMAVKRLVVLYPEA